MEMTVQTIVDEFKQALKRVEVEYRNSLDKVSMLKDVQKLSLPTGSIENIRAGSSLRVYHWIADKLVEKGLAKPEEDVVDLKSILQLRWKEKNNPTELQDLPRYFYLKIKEHVGKRDSEVIPHLKDIYSLRLSKIMSLASKRVSKSAVENLTAEEKVLYECLLRIVDAWYEFIDPGDEG